MPEPFPPLEPYDSGHLDVGDGNLVYWETSGNPDGIPALCVHGGPGSGSRGGSRRAFDPARFRIVIYDQRGCGSSTPSAAFPATDMSVNTTEHLIADMERLRKHLRVDRWLLFGGSWGSTLILAYAERHPERVTGIVIPSVTTTRRHEIDWLYRGVGRFFPAAWERFRAGATGGFPAGDGDDGDLVGAYARLMEHPDHTVRLKAATDWCAWEDAVISAEPLGRRGVYSDRNETDLLAFVRICSHYFAAGAWLDEGALLAGADRLAGIRGVLIHGALDLGGPLDTAWQLARAWPDAHLEIIDDSGHTGSPAMSDAVLKAIASFGGTRA